MAKIESRMEFTYCDYVVRLKNGIRVTLTENGSSDPPLVITDEFMVGYLLKKIVEIRPYKDDLDWFVSCGNGYRRRWFTSKNTHNIDRLEMPEGKTEIERLIRLIV